MRSILVVSALVIEIFGNQTITTITLKSHFSVSAGELLIALDEGPKLMGNPQVSE
jgi:hypothetical protein